MPKMSRTTAIVTLTGLADYSQSMHHDEPFLEGESHDAYNKRVWASQLHVGSDGLVCIPASAVHQCLVAAGKYSSRKIVGQGNKTWTAKLQAGLAIYADPCLDVTPDKFKCVAIYSNADGVRGSGKRVTRFFPVIGPGWTTTFEINILDPIITREIFEEMVEIAGLFVGLGRWRPEKGGLNGRFEMSELMWQAAPEIREDYSRAA